MTTQRAAGVAIAAVLSGVLGAWPGAALTPVPALHIDVTGELVPVEMLRLAVVTGLRTTLPGALDADISVLSAIPPLTPLLAGGDATVQTEVRVAASGARPAVYSIPVAIANVVLPLSDAEALLVSNSPERLPFGKVLYLGTLAAPQTVRLLYHHQNGSRNRHLFLLVGLSNPARVPVRLWASAASGGPGPDEFIAGHEAASRFLGQYWHHAGFLVTIPANTTVPLFLHDLPPQAAVSGLAQIALVEGERLNVQVTARLEGEMDPPTVSYEPDFDRSHQRGAFARPQVARFLTYTVWGPPLVMTLGDRADLLRGGGTGIPLSGNYGVMYMFVVQAANSASTPATIALVMHADGGEARGTFLVDRTIISSPVVRPGAPQVLTTIPFGPLERRTLRIATMPESASSYPVRLTLERR